MDEPSWKKGVAELVGTFTLIYVGVLVLVGGFGSKGDLVAIALAHGFAIAVMVSATMSISGGQLNPAVTTGLLIGRKITPAQAGINILMQLVGGILGGYLAKASLGGADITGGVPDLGAFPGGAAVTVGTGILIEAILTFFLVFVVFGTGVDARFGARIGGLAIGLTVALDIMAGGPLTGGAMNPARWVGAAIPAMHFNNALVYIVGPLAGAIAAGLLYTTVLEGPRPHPEPAVQMRAKDNP
ncbi:MAG TPA: aquaporin [Candidatus Thermoplasmatota archaeon]|nr:aquaporin [Candidatus Thermoplasmatota archaeon]